VTEPAIPADILTAVKVAQGKFLTVLHPLRPALHAYCRRLTGNPWDAEDLVQETLTRAFARAAQTPGEVRHPLAWLVRIATNAYLDSCRRPAPLPAELPDRAGPTGADPLEVRDALTAVSVLLPPQERAAYVLREVFDLPAARIADLLGTSVGAVKAALHRGRDRLDRPDDAHRPAPTRAVLDALADAFTAYDLERLAALLAENAESEIVGVRHETGRVNARDGSLRHTLEVETDVRYRAEVVELAGEAVVALWEDPADGGPGGLGDVLRLDTMDGQVTRIRWYYFCPETLTECAGHLGWPARTHGYGR
jgi:RNA polymerase sigma-70 factor (ECF subfamily)